MKLKLLKGDPSKVPGSGPEGQFMLEDREDLYRALAVSVVPSSEWWVPLRTRASPFEGRPGKPNLNFMLCSAEEFCPAWDRLEAQVGLCLSAFEYPAAAYYTLHMLGVSHRSSHILWEDTPYNSRMWVRQGESVLPIPRESAIENILHLWWALSGGFLNYEQDLLSLCSYNLKHFPFYSRADEKALRSHPSRTIHRHDQWGGEESRTHDEVRRGCLWREGIPIARETRGNRHPPAQDVVFDWYSDDMLPCLYGVEWLDRQRHILHRSLYRACVAHRRGMRSRVLGE